ncbi:hypothetical protein HRbin33_02179 [bacterium HR33]|nr:hypothetical protein HRbin33_02179 [bacterium HR33]
MLEARELELVIKPAVRTQLVSADTRGLVEGAIAAGRILVIHVKVNDKAELDALVEWSELVDDGEAGCHEGSPRFATCWMRRARKQGRQPAAEPG